MSVDVTVTGGGGKGTDKIRRKWKKKKKKTANIETVRPEWNACRTKENNHFLAGTSYRRRSTRSAVARACERYKRGWPCAPPRRWGTRPSPRMAFSPFESALSSIGADDDGEAADHRQSTTVSIRRLFSSPCLSEFSFFFFFLDKILFISNHIVVSALLCPCVNVVFFFIRIWYTRPRVVIVLIFKFFFVYNNIVNYSVPREYLCAYLLYSHRRKYKINIKTIFAIKSVRPIRARDPVKIFGKIHRSSRAMPRRRRRWADGHFFRAPPAPLAPRNGYQDVRLSSPSPHTRSAANEKTDFSRRRHRPVASRSIRANVGQGAAHRSQRENFEKSRQQGMFLIRRVAQKNSSASTPGPGWYSNVQFIF